MKKLAVLFLFSVFIIKSHSQITKGNWLVGGSMAYSKENSSRNDVVNRKERTIDVSGNVGYFIVPKLTGGIRLNSFFSKQKYPQIDGSYSTISQNNLGVGPFARYYFLNAENQINIFTDEGILYSVLRIKSTSTQKSYEKTLKYYFSGGAVIFLNTSVGIELILSYNNTKVIKYDSKGESVQFRVGLQFYLEKE